MGYPAPLRPGDRVGIVSPAGPVDGERLRAGLALIRARGFEPVLGRHVHGRSKFFAGTDEERLADLTRLLRDPSIKAVFCARGGYGSQRLLPGLSRVIPHLTPKLFVGYSDITALHALFQKAGWVTWHGPMPGDWARLPDGGASLDALFAGLTGRLVGRLPSPHHRQPQTLVPGVARGRLVGGNLSLVAALLGTEYAVDMDGAILFLEDVGEAPYRIDRMLSSLQLAGHLNRVAGVVLGDFTDCAPPPGGAAVTVEDVLRSHFAQLGVPVLWQYPAGHGSVNMPLPLGLPVELDATRGAIRMLEVPVSV